MRNFLSLLLLLCAFNCFSQVVDKVESENNIYDITGIDVKPECPEGSKKFNSYLVELIQKVGFKQTSKTKIAVLFVVEKDGSLNDIKFIGKIDSAIAKELVEEIKNLPHWNPGILKGKTVRTLKAHPIVFN